MTTSAHPAKTTVHLLSLNHLPIFGQLQLEEALLRTDERNWCILNHGTTPAIVMGISGVHEKLIDQNYLKKKEVPVIRRFSGGGTVFVDENTVFATWICNTNDTHVPCFPHNVHEWAANFYQQAFPLLGMHLRENDYVIGERKWGGNAQYLTKGRWLHHTSMLWDYNSENMNYLLMPAKIPAYRQLRTHDDFLCRLKKYFADQEEIKTKIQETLSHKFDVIKVSLDQVTDILNKPHRKATTISIKDA